MSPGIPAVVIARVAAQAARGVPGVVDLSGGAVGEFATFGVGERVSGIRAKAGDPATVTVRVVAEFGESLPALADRIRQRVGDVLGQFPGLESRAAAVVSIDIVDVEVATQRAALPATASPDSEAPTAAPPPPAIRPPDVAPSVVRLEEV